MLLFKLFTKKSKTLARFSLAPDVDIANYEGTGFNKIKQCRHGLMVFNQNDQYIGKSLELYGEFSEYESHIFQHFLEDGYTVVEVGANIGAHTISLASAVGPAGAVHAFEPQRLIFQTLCANLAINSVANVHAYHAAAGRMPGNIVVPELDPTTFQNFGGLSIEGHTQGTTVPIKTIDDLSLSSCHLIKVDVEGMEEEVLSGAVTTIEKYRPVLYVENDRREKSPSLIRFIQSLGYRMWWHLPPLYNPANYLGNHENIFANLVSINFLCLPKERETELQDNDVTSPDEWPF